MGLRLREGVDLSRIAELAETKPDELVDGQAVDRLAAQGLLKREENILRVEPPGMLLLDAILAEIVR
jgi:oxygen-independent coproporphyrinogen-3 oxidase